MGCPEESSWPCTGLMDSVLGLYTNYYFCFYLSFSYVYVPITVVVIAILSNDIQIDPMIPLHVS